MIQRIQNRRTEMVLMNVGLGTKWYCYLFDVVYVLTGVAIG